MWDTFFKGLKKIYEWIAKLIDNFINKNDDRFDMKLLKNQFAKVLP